MMVRRPSSSLNWRRVFRPSYYLNRPERFMTIFIVFICLIYLFWNPHVLMRDHREQVSRFEKDIDQMHSQIRELNKHLGKISGKISIESSNARFKENHTERDYQLNIRRREMVKKSMVHAWTSYEKYAWGKDELQPQSKSGIDNFCGLGATIVDSLDTLYIMGLNTQFQKAKEWVALSLNSNKECEASVFETNIRIVGGLLSAYDLSDDKLFLEKAKDIADRLLPAWNTLSGIPYNKINLASGHAYNPSGGFLTCCGIIIR